MPSITINHLLLIPAISSLIFSALPGARAYIPAIPINDTSTLNRTDSSTISIAWQNPPGIYSGGVSYQLQADIPTNGTTAGALVHFSESTMGPNVTTRTPWIAFISCEVNETGASMEWDVFTLARDRGAVSALLYTTESQSCLLNPFYVRDFEQPLDVFATRTSAIARVIESQFRHTNNTYLNYNAAELNASGGAVNVSLAGARFNSTSYLIGILQARDSTGQATPTDIPGSAPRPTAESSNRPPASMIALYVITGAIGSGFILMLLLGWRRARLHPERYGRRDEDGEAPRTTAAGLAQAMLDTFPVIKFNRRGGAGGAGGGLGGTSADEQFGDTKPKRIDSDNDFHMAVLSSTDHANPSSPVQNHRQSGGYGTGGIMRMPSTSSSIAKGDDGGSEKTRVQVTSRAASGKTVSRPTSGGIMDGPVLEQVGEAAGGEICPICLLEFEEGDDLRVLPCEREHMYHQGCIDPWLLQVSGSCPLCRKDFTETSTTAGSTSSPQNAVAPLPSAPTTGHSGSAQPPTTGGFARYLAFMRRERHLTLTRRQRADTTFSSHTGGGSEAEGQGRPSGERGGSAIPPEEDEEIESVVWGPRARSTSGPATTSGHTKGFGSGGQGGPGTGI